MVTRLLDAMADFRLRCTIAACLAWALWEDWRMSIHAGTVDHGA